MSINQKLSNDLLDIQQIAIKVADEVFNQLEVGMTEIDAVNLLKESGKNRGISHYFHYPFAWFGDRTMFKNFSQPLPILSKSTWKKIQLPKSLKELPHFGQEFMPSNIKLENNMPVILDLAPVKNDVFADIGHSKFFGDSDEHKNMMAFLDKLKMQIPDIIRTEKKINRIYSHIDRLIADNDYINCHGLYPLGVLGHKVGKYPKLKLPIRKFSLMGFAPEAFIFLLAQNLTAPFYYSKKTPFLTADINQEISDGYWAIEPHIGFDNMGAKFEEILIINGNTIEWLSQ
ncbi:MAG: M24 family metallopeptidase [Bacteriovoracaceae bacterium]|jgi:hypothetical protein|nr:M24 family metallopeptidase [Bacteriovoracaceae bacterium]